MTPANVGVDVDAVAVEAAGEESQSLATWDPTGAKRLPKLLLQKPPL